MSPLDDEDRVELGHHFRSREQPRTGHIEEVVARLRNTGGGFRLFQIPMTWVTRSIRSPDA